MNKVTVLSVNISEKKGTIKLPVPSISLTEKGVEGDAHSGPWNRQVSLLGIESIRKFEQDAGRKINFGEFAENITTEGLELWKCQPLDRFVGEEVELEVTQIGKECHGSTCSIFKEVGNCVMPKEGIFARVIRPGTLNAKCKMQNAKDTEQRATSNEQRASEFLYKPKVYSARIITLSDRAFRGDYEDKSGPRIRTLLETFFSPLVPLPSSFVPRPSSHVSRLTSHLFLLPDSPDQLRMAIEQAIYESTDFIFTTGGTGIGPRDFTPDVVKPLLDKEIPGIMERIRMKYGAEKPNALLSRSVAGVRNKTLLFTLPGSLRAVNEYMEEITPSLLHMVYMLHGLEIH
ncbi:MAG: molybdopterin-binding protein [bacterium]